MDIGLFQRRWSGRLALNTKCFFTLFKWGWICIVMWRSYFRDEEEEKMRFSDQIDPGNGALRSWQAESERLLFDESGRSRWGRGSMERWSVTLQPTPPPHRLLDLSLLSPPYRCSIIQLVLALGSLVEQWPHISTAFPLCIHRKKMKAFPLVLLSLDWS